MSRNLNDPFYFKVPRIMFRILSFVLLKLYLLNFKHTFEKDKRYFYVQLMVHFLFYQKGRINNRYLSSYQGMKKKFFID